MPQLNRRVIFCCAALIAAQPGIIAAAEQHAGRLEASDKAMNGGGYYDDWPFQASAGQSIKFLIKAKDFSPYAMLYTDGGELIEHTHGVYGDGGYALGTQWKIPSADGYHLIVTSSFREELDYTLTWEVVD